MAFFNEFPHTRNYDGDLGWLIEAVRKLIECCDQMTEWKETHEEEYKELKHLYDDLLIGNLPDTFESALKNWVSKNIFDIMGDLVHNVFFGLTDAGYFIAYIPDNWSDLIFNTTGYDIIIPEIDYGHLTLSY